MRTRHSGFGTHKIDEATPRDSTRGRTRHSRHCAEGRFTGLFADDAQTMRIRCADHAQPIHRPQRQHTDRTLGGRGRSARKSDPRTVRGGRCSRRVAPTRWPSGLCTDMNTRRPRAWMSMEAVSMEEHGGRERAEGANDCRQFQANFQKLRHRKSAGQDWAGLGSARAGEQREVERVHRWGQESRRGSVFLREFRGKQSRQRMAQRASTLKE